MRNVLEEICQKKQLHVEACKKRLPLNQLEKQLKTAPSLRPFRHALTQKITQGNYGLIAEVKKASPSKGLIRADFNPIKIAQSYEAGGAACLSVLTDTPYFQGEDHFLIEARSACSLPVLRKDFMLDPYQIIEARTLGADCILLIVAALSDEKLKELFTLTRELGMDVLIEVHNLDELQRVAHYQDCLMGINNRNLKTLEVSLETTKQLTQYLSNEHEIVCESGLFSSSDLKEMATFNAKRFLVGESLMRQDDVTLATQKLLNLA